MAKRDLRGVVRIGGELHVRQGIGLHFFVGSFSRGFVVKGGFPFCASSLAKYLLDYKVFFRESFSAAARAWRAGVPFAMRVRVSL